MFKNYAPTPGFTLLELMIILALVLLTCSIAIPSFNELIAHNRQQALLDQVRQAVQSARSAAILQRQTVELCGTTNHIDCSGDWANGWLIRLQKNQQPLHTTQLTESDPLRWRGFSSAIRFHSNGTSSASNGRFYQCYEQRIAWQLILNRQGRLRQAKAAENKEMDQLCYE